MIIDSFHDEKESLFSPGNFFGEKQWIADTAIATFSFEIFESVLASYPHQQVARISSVNGHKPVYLIDCHGRKLIFYQSAIGSCLAGNDIIEVQWMTGVSRLMIFGSAGSLDSQLTTGKYVIPTQAYRDEGMSYHYAPASDYMTISNADKLASVFQKLRLPFVKGRVWTTDAPYRETLSAVTERKTDGCIAVEMELAGLQAVCSFHQIDLYAFLVTGDILDQDEYLSEGLHSANHSIDKFRIALRILEESVPGNQGNLREDQMKKEE